MTTITTIKINQLDKQLKKWLLQQTTNSTIGKVHSIYNQVINFISQDESKLFSIAVKDIPQAPQMMKISSQIQFNDLKARLKPSMPIYLLDEMQLQLDTININFDGANSWMGSLHTPQLVRSDLTLTGLKKINNFINLFGLTGGLLRPWQRLNCFKHEDDHFNKDVYAQQFLKNLQQLQASQSPSQLIAQFKKIVGLGIGLTPAGDDFLTGAIATWIYYCPNFKTAILKERDNFLNDIKTRTTLVSYFMIENCLHGYVNEPVLQLIKKLSINCESEMRQVLNIGSSSGTDLLIGVSFAYEWLLNN